MADEVEENQVKNEEIKPKHPGGRPRILQDLEVAKSIIDLYFQKNPDKPTMCGLALDLGFEDRRSLLDYIKRGDEFSAPIKRALARIESRHEQRMYEGQPAGSIFWLKNRGWRDSHDVTSGGEKITPQVVSFADVAIKQIPESPESNDNPE